MKTMTLIELQSVLGERIKIAQNKDLPIEERKAETDLSQTIASLAKKKTYHANPLYIENKSKRLQLLTKPSTAEKLRAKAQREGRSVNDIVNTILEEALREE